MTAKNKITEKGVLESTIKKFMTPQAVADMKILMENPTLQQFLLRWQEADHEILGDQLKEELKEFLKNIYLKDNDALCKNVADTVRKELIEVLAPINSTLESIEKNLGKISGDIRIIKEEIIDIKKRLKTDEDILSDMDKRITTLEKYSSKTRTITRGIIIGLITGIITISMGVIIFLEIHARLLN